MTSACKRCGAPVETRLPPGDDARMLRRSKTTGVCANCAVTIWLKGMEPIASTLKGRGPELLLDDVVRAQFGLVMVSARADMDEAEIDWPTVVEQWELP